MRARLTSRNRLALGLLAAALALSLTGCMWLRLLALKNQLADFDRFVQVDDRDGLAFRLVKPVLRVEDVRYLLDAEPSFRRTNQNRLTWVWTFEKLADGTNAATRDYDLSFSTSFEQGKLCELAISDRFRAIMPKEMVLGMARSLGEAKVDRAKREVTARWRQTGPNKEIEALSRPQILQLLGPPTKAEDAPQALTHHYHYSLGPPGPSKDQSRLARVRCVYARDTDKLKQIEVAYGTMKVSLSFAESK
jgi:hypothetical protein